MLKLIKNVHVYAPENLGKKDVLLIGDKIGAVENEITLHTNLQNLELIDGAGRLLVPGFIDAHVHITGGGGEGSYHTRTPELMLTDATTSGITTIVGVLGTDGTTRTMTGLIAKARALEEEGISCYVHTGSYQVPVKTLTDSIENDLILIDKIIGVGEIAIADHRSSQPTMEELAKIASSTRVGGMLSGKGGIVNIHVGDSPTKLSLIERVVEETDIPIAQFYPTHINRNHTLFEAGIRFAKNGGYVDFTTSTVQRFLDQGEVRCSTGLKKMLEAGVPIQNITFTSDGQASLPEFNKQGELIGLQVGKVRSLFQAVREAILEEGIALDVAVRVITENPAKILKLTQKGTIATGKDADLVMLDPHDLTIQSVFAKGKMMVSGAKAIVKGTFEE
ncbi:beta-aspartyl-dipeptidase (metallo-type) [Bacillus tianshenii]|uniref:Isoaspartyl dipeptidase n=1 Tax=Sutcliffiella tianshenii TaxID=1463404 RepID=A0ABS2NXQ5_9BACI|nr:beta-aspartyl-peptidase [Bacillus tianshenii]MBM7619431.1 beta-aspartyl-dipeptidase (metallo-type) [Bacillus tianshenii]